MAHEKRMQILSESEVDDLYSVPQFTDEQREYYFTLDDHEEALKSNRNEPVTNAYTILLLGYFKYKPVILNPDISEIRKDLGYIRDKYKLQLKIPQRTIGPTQKSRIYSTFMKVIEHSTYDENKHRLTQFVYEISKQNADPREIFDRCIQYLSERRVAIPAYSTLQKVISSGIHHEENKLHQALLSLVPEELYLKLRAMSHAEDEKPLVTQIKQLPTSFKPSEIHHEVKIFQKTKEVFPCISGIIAKLDLSKSNIQYYSSQVTYLKITQLRETSKPVFCLYLMCFLYQRHHQAGDILVSALTYHVRKLESEAKKKAENQLHEDLLGMNDKIKKAAQLLAFYVDDSISGKTTFAAVREKAFKVLNRKQMVVVSNYLSELEIDVKRYEWDYYQENRNKIKKTLRQIFMCLDISGTDPTGILIRQAQKTRGEFSEHGEMRSFDLRLIKRNLKPYLLDENEQFNPVKAEMLLYLQIEGRIKIGQLFVNASFSHKSIDDDLVAAHDVEALIAGSASEKLKREPEDLLRELLAQLDKKLEHVNRRLAAGENPHLILSEVNGKMKFSIKPLKRDKESVDTERFLSVLQQTHIGDIVEFTQRQTQFASALRHVRIKNKQLPDLNSAIACIVANGTRCGIHHMSELCNIPYDALRKTQKNHLRVETLHEANDFITNATAKTKIYPYYHIQPNIVHASYDGQKFHSRFNTIRTRYSSKYLGRGKGLSAISLSANYIPVNAKMMGLNEHESHYLYDVLHHNTSEVQPDLVSTDTHGTNQVNFALLDLSGWQHAPRYARPGKVLADLFTCEEINGAYQIKMKKPISEKKFVDGWPSLQRIMVSLECKTASQATIVRKLSRGSSDTKFQALLEYDRLIKSLFMLDYLDDENLRRHVQRALNRGESYHLMQRRLEQVSGGKFRGGDDNEIDLWYECGRLICNCVIFFNSYLLSELLEGFEKKKQDKPAELVKRCTPNCWAHVNFNGTYTFSFDGARLDISGLVQQMINRFA